MPSNWYLGPASEGITRGRFRLYLELEIISAAPENLLKFWIVKILGTYKVTETLFYVLLVNKRNYKVCTRGTNPNQSLEPITAVLSACRFGAWGLSVRIATYPCSYWIFHLHHQASNLKASSQKKGSWGGMMQLPPHVPYDWCNLRVFQGREEKTTLFSLQKYFQDHMNLTCAVHCSGWENLLKRWCQETRLCIP